jgi:hypothetical protein
MVIRYNIVNLHITAQNSLIYSKNDVISCYFISLKQVKKILKVCGSLCLKNFKDFTLDMLIIFSPNLVFKRLVLRMPDNEYIYITT